nr:MAG TPA: hypothetical protein [Caudoviricetes sp.]
MKGLLCFFVLVYGRIHHFLFIKLLGAVRLGKLGNKGVSTCNLFGKEKKWQN